MAKINFSKKVVDDLPAYDAKATLKPLTPGTAEAPARPAPKVEPAIQDAVRGRKARIVNMRSKHHRIAVPGTGFLIPTDKFVPHEVTPYLEAQRRGGLLEFE